MLCDEILDYKEYKRLEKIMKTTSSSAAIFEANYNLERIDVKGLLYGSNWKTYIELPVDENGQEIYQEHGMWVDTADTGAYD